MSAVNLLEKFEFAKILVTEAAKKAPKQIQLAGGMGVWVRK
jgi:hypothetical protein